jgi:hypothetical protein
LIFSEPTKPNWTDFISFYKNRSIFIGKWIHGLTLLLPRARNSPPWAAKQDDAPPVSTVAGTEAVTLAERGESEGILFLILKLNWGFLKNHMNFLYLLQYKHCGTKRMFKLSLASSKTSLQDPISRPTHSISR